jgi:hypothetical protein
MRWLTILFKVRASPFFTWEYNYKGLPIFPFWRIESFDLVRRVHAIREFRDKLRRVRESLTPGRLSGISIGEDSRIKG